MLRHPLRALIAKARRRPISVVYDDAYRLPFSGVEFGNTLETRRAEDSLDYLFEELAIGRADLLKPELASYEALGRVHTEAYLESLQSKETIARIFAVDPSDAIDEVLRAVRLATGGTVLAARETLKGGQPVVNLLGGFHHAAPARGAGFCALNDVAVAVTTLRREGFSGKVGVLDCDFHPPDGTAECLGEDPSVWLGSISGESWGALPGVDETVLPAGTDDATYLTALAALLKRMPTCDLVFVLAGGDVLSGDRLGKFALSLNGVRSRELAIAERLAGVPQVWLPAGGYGPHAWKVVAGVGLALAFHSSEPIPSDYDPVRARMNGIARSLPSESLGDSLSLSEADVAEALGSPEPGAHRLLGFYSREGIEFALERYKLLPIIRRLGFEKLRVEIQHRPPWDRAVLFGCEQGKATEYPLVELEVGTRVLADKKCLYVNWLSLRNPRAKFSGSRPQLPGQEVPGLGLAREMTQLLGLMARRLQLKGVAFRPSWFHMAFAARHTARFIASDRQARFEALLGVTARVPLLEATRTLAEGKWLLNGVPYTWEADDMVEWLPAEAPGDDREEITRLRDGYRFEMERPA